MGFDKIRFLDQSLSGEFECAVCLEICEDPVQVHGCGHIFCRPCISDCLRNVQPSRCPSCNRVNVQIEEIDRRLRNVWSKLQLKCYYASCGCKENVTIENEAQHRSVCRARRSSATPTFGSFMSDPTKSVTVGNIFTNLFSRHGNEDSTSKCDYVRKEMGRFFGDSWVCVEMPAGMSGISTHDATDKLVIVRENKSYLIFKESSHLAKKSEAETTENGFIVGTVVGAVSCLVFGKILGSLLPLVAMTAAAVLLFRFFSTQKKS